MAVEPVEWVLVLYQQSHVDDEHGNASANGLFGEMPCHIPHMQMA